MKKKSPDVFIAARIKHDLPNKQTENMPVQFLPDYGGIITNMVYCDTREISQTIALYKPFEIQGFTARLMVEVWGLQNGARKLLKETWYFSQRPPQSTPQEYISAILDREKNATISEASKRQAERPAAFIKSQSGKHVDPWENAKQATLELMKAEYPLLARALDAKQSTPETAKAFIADCVRLTGCMDADVNLKDPKFVAQLSDAYQAHDRRNARKSKVDPADWFLANPRSWSQLHALPMAEIASRVFSATKINLLPAAVEKRIERLGLITPRKSGKPTKK